MIIFSPAMSGPEFLTFYVCLLAALVVAAGLLRHGLRGPADDGSRPPLDPYQAAFLAGGYRGGAEAAIVALSARGMLRLDPGGRFVAVAGQSDRALDRGTMPMTTCWVGSPKWPESSRALAYLMRL